MTEESTVPDASPHPDRLFPSDPVQRRLARELYGHVYDLPLICPHGHVDPALLAHNKPFGNPAELLVVPDHYVLRMLYSRGVALEDLGVPSRDGWPVEDDPRAIWRRLAEHWHLFRGTPSRLWLEQALHEVFDVTTRLSADTADEVYDQLEDCLAQEAFLPRALFDRFNIECLATTESPLDSLEHHRAIRDSDWAGNVVTTFRPDDVVDMERDGWASAVARLGEVTGCDTATYGGYLEALQTRRTFFARNGATATDHGHPTAATLDLDQPEAARLFEAGLRGRADATTAERFRAHMLTEFARMSCEDGLVMQLHPGSLRDHNARVFARFGRDMGADIPMPTDYVRALRPLLNRFGNDPHFTLVVFTLDESAYSRELAPLAGHYPAMLLGPPWWFHDSPEGMRRFRELATETAGFYNTVGFNDDTRAFPSIAARHDVARRVDCAFLARLVAEHRLALDEATETAVDLAYRLPKRTYRIADDTGA
ncbi:MAG: glucuronate isomerase [Actinomycetota bacterium]|nr:glucuronate isomerase [Actinomycetota bacterium]